MTNIEILCAILGFTNVLAIIFIIALIVIHERNYVSLNQTYTNKYNECKILQYQYNGVKERCDSIIKSNLKLIENGYLISDSLFALKETINSFQEKVERGADTLIK